MNIAILDDYQDVVGKLQCFTLLNDHQVTIFNDTPGTSDQLVSRLQNMDCIVLIRERTNIDAALLKQLPNLKLISQTGKISNHLNLSDCSKYNVAVAEGIGSPIAPSELCWLLIMAANRHLVPYVNNLKSGNWQQSGQHGLGRALNGLTLGIWGYGKIGQRIAAYGKAFNMQVLVWGREPSREKAVADGYNAASSKSDFFEKSDVVSVHLRLNETTANCIELNDLKLMKPDAVFINTSRSGLVVKGALIEALKTGHPGFAAIDVYDNEPADATEEELINMENVLCTPHLGYVEKNSYELYFKAAFENVIAFFRGQPQNIANEQVLQIPDRF